MGRSENVVLDQAVQGKRERKASKRVVVDEQGVSLVVRFADGQEGTVALPSSLLKQFAGIGLSVVVGEAVGKAASVNDAIQAFNELAVKIESGEFKRGERKAVGEKEPSDIVQAIAEAAGWSLEKASTTYASADKATKAALRTDHRTKAVLARLRGKEVASANKVDFASL